MEPKIETLIVNLTDKTNKKESKWERIGKSEQFQLTLENGKVSVDKFLSAQKKIVYQFIIYNSNGDSIILVNGIKKEEFSIIDTDYDIIKSLHESIKKSYFKVDETLEGLIEESKKEGEIGKDNDQVLF